ncbi:MAG: ornithine carbamoyltransferase [Candidatus Altiarchaeales archaeon]|nr:MAG: ornithine carbamoyltransferase [Candidatus Altiarchaeales archaeon]
MDLLSMTDLSIKELESIIRETGRIKARPEDYKDRLKGKILVMLFEGPSTRTRVSFETAMIQLGGNAIDINESMTQLGRGETMGDSARVLSRYSDCILARVKRHETLMELARNSEVPVINGLSDLEHPCQVISDLFTIHEVRGRLKGIDLAYIGDGNNVCNSLLLGCSMVGINIKVASPEGYEPAKNFVKKALDISKETGSRIEIVNDPREAAKGASFLYTDVWVSMGDESEEEERLKAFRGYQLNREIVKLANSDCKIMHCLPAHRGLEITDEVIDGRDSIVWDQAENRLHAQKAILLRLLG